MLYNYSMKTQKEINKLKVLSKGFCIGLGIVIVVALFLDTIQLRDLRQENQQLKNYLDFMLISDKIEVCNSNTFFNKGLYNQSRDYYQDKLNQLQAETRMRTYLLYCYNKNNEN